MRLVAVATLVFASTLSMSAAAQKLPQCNSQLLTRQGHSVTMKLDTLAAEFNQKLEAAHAKFRNIQLAPAGNDELKVSGEKNGSPISISGPLSVTNSGAIQLHAKHIKKDGSDEKGIMDLFGKELSDYVNLQKTRSMHVQKDNLIINPDKLLGLRGRVKNVQLNSSSVELQFASQPCR